MSVVLFCIHLSYLSYTVSQQSMLTEKSTILQQNYPKCAPKIHCLKPYFVYFETRIRGIIGSEIFYFGCFSHKILFV